MSATKTRPKPERSTEYERRTDREYKRLKRVLDAWGKNYDKYFDALTKKPEADYARAKIDAAMKLICGDSQDFIPFEQRYEWLPEIRYDRRG